MAYWGATKEYTSFWSNNEQVANICICNGLCGSDPTNIRKGKASREKWPLHLFYFLMMSRYVPLTVEHTWCLALSLMSLSNQCLLVFIQSSQAMCTSLPLSLRMQPQNRCSLNNHMMSCHQKTDQLRRNTKGKTVKDCFHARLNQNDSRYKLNCSL